MARCVLADGAFWLLSHYNEPVTKMHRQPVQSSRAETKLFSQIMKICEIINGCKLMIRKFRSNRAVNLTTLTCETKATSSLL